MPVLLRIAAVILRFVAPYRAVALEKQDRNNSELHDSLHYVLEALPRSPLALIIFSQRAIPLGPGQSAVAAL